MFFAMSAAAPLIDPPVMAPRLHALPDANREAAAEIAVGEQLLERGLYVEAAHALSGINTGGDVELAFRAFLGASWGRLYAGELDEALELAERARVLSERPEFTDVHRADALFHLGCVQLKLSNVALAISLYTVALELCDRSGAACDRLRADALQWRSRGYQLRRDWDAARSDVERALELSLATGDEHVNAHALFQASLIAERTNQTMLAVYYAEQAKDIYERLDDRRNIGRLLNNLGGLLFLLGRHDEAVSNLERAVALALEMSSTADAAQAISSLAQVHRRTGDLAEAEEQARYALELLDGRLDFIDERGNAQLVLGRTLTQRGAHDEAELVLEAADESFERLSSMSHRAAVTVAQGDLARLRGDGERASDLYRAAAESLQDFHF
jgi:tetratricopeptide (TPR) repeat protein